MTLSRRHVLTHSAALTAAAALPAEAQAQTVLQRPNVSPKLRQQTEELLRDLEKKGAHR